jgi:hypothetical protein
LPATPPPEGTGRVLVDTVGEVAKVSRVVDTLTTADPYGAGNGAYRLRWGMAPMELQRTELLCMTPCSVDLRQGAHTLLFESLSDPTRRSSADINVTAPLSAVRHSLGRNKPLSPATLAGIMLIAGGSALTLAGATVAAVGATASNTPGPDSPGFNRPEAIGIGLGTLGVGLVLGVIGAVVTAQHRPIEQPGSTIEWDLHP